MPERTVFFVSDGTGITAETFGNSILAQFRPSRATCAGPSSTRREGARGGAARSTEPRARGQAPHRLHHPGQRRGARIVTSPHCKGLVLDMFRTFVEPLEEEFGVKSNHRVGRFSDASQSQEYNDRIEAINFSLAHDDGQSRATWTAADVILVGVSRSGKTPTSLYLAMQHGIKAANYPLIPEDFERGKLPGRRWRPTSASASA
jgi:regulator of PEP synthase PpsR (kinase-PPPase family)